MSKSVHFNERQISSLSKALADVIAREGEGKDPKDVHIRYLGDLLTVKQKLEKEVAT